MEKTSKITRTVFKNEWSGQNGVVFYHEIEMENGDKGQIGCKEKEPAKINPGQTLTYTIEKTDKGNKIKAVSPKPPFNSGKPQQDPKTQMISFAMAYTKDLVVGGKLQYEDIENGFENIYRIMTKKLA